MASRPMRDAVAEQRHRDIIKTTQLLNRLQAYGLGENDVQTAKPVDMSPAQVKAIIALLKKTVPDLQSIEGNLDVKYRHEDAIKDLE